MLSGHQIRRTFLDFFAANGHRIVRSSSLVPIGDPTLLFTNAGMNQFKDVFLGLEQRDYKRATSAQKCVRAGGKHNDLENVGFTNRHHTFFEMLGNFSFGDYFKKDAIAFAMELVTSPKWFGIPLEKLYFTVFGGAEIAPGVTLGADEEAPDFGPRWARRKDRVLRIPGLKENFWAMGDTGPCGPCSEMHYDMGPAASNDGHTDCAFGCECGRYVEIWNLVFMQFNRDASGKVAPLPRPSIDTGAGLERMAAVIQGKISNFDTDLFRPLMDFASKLCGKAYGAAPESDASLRILADHSRASAFLISDGVMPSNEGRGYVLRKIIRRAVRHGRMLGIEGPFLYEMAQQVAEQMSEPYPELLESIGRVSGVIQARRGALRAHHRYRPAQAGRGTCTRYWCRNAKTRNSLFFFPGKKRSGSTIPSACLSISSQMWCATRARIRFCRVSSAPWKSSARARALPGKARTKRSPVPPMPSLRKRFAPSLTFTSAPARAIAASRPSSPLAAA